MLLLFVPKLVASSDFSGGGGSRRSLQSCFSAGSNVEIIPGSRYAGQASGNCGTLTTSICLTTSITGGFESITFSNGYSNTYQYSDLQLCTGTAPSICWNTCAQASDGDCDEKWHSPS